MRDSDGYLIEVGQTMIPGPLDLYTELWRTKTCPGKFAV